MFFMNEIPEIPCNIQAIDLLAILQLGLDRALFLSIFIGYF